MIGRRTTVLIGDTRRARSSLVGLSVTIWNYLQLISGVPRRTVGRGHLRGVVVETQERAGAIAGGAAGLGFGMFLFLDQTLGWSLVWHPILLTSFLHRSILVWFFCSAHDGCGEPVDCAARSTKSRAMCSLQRRSKRSAARITASGPACCSICTVILWWTVR